MAAARSGHTATLLPDGRVLIVGGADATGSGISAVEVFDPAASSFSTAAGSLLTGRFNHSATLLDNHKLFIAGGASANGMVLSSSEIYDPVAQTSSAGPGLLASRENHTAARLANGQVFIAGGTGAGGGGSGAPVLKTTEIFTPPGSIAEGPAMTLDRTNHTATVLANGELLIAEGFDNTFGYLRSAEIFENNVGTFTATAPAGHTRRAFTTTPLADGTVLIAGGVDSTGSATAAAEIYNPANASSIPLGNMTVARGGHTATLLADGRVLIAGGANNTGLLSSAEVYTPVGLGHGSFSAVGSMAGARVNHAAAMLPDGEVLITGGQDPSSQAVCSAEIFNPSTSQFIITESMHSPRVFHTATPLPNGQIFIAGGFDQPSGPTHDRNPLGNALDTAELYDLKQGAFIPISVNNNPHVLRVARAEQSATLLLDKGIVLLAGGRFRGFFQGTFYDVALNDTEVFVPYLPADQQRFFQVGSMAFQRAQHTATLLPNGQVLVAGGTGCQANSDAGCAIASVATALDSAELFSTTQFAFFPAGSAPVSARAQGGAALLTDAKVLLAGGVGSSGAPQASQELFDYASVLSTAPAPVISSFPPSLTAGSTVTIHGSGFQSAEASGGNNTQNSPTNYPVVLLRRVGEAIAQALTVEGFSNNQADTSGTISAMLPAVLPSGQYQANLIVAGRTSSLVFSEVAAAPTPPKAFSSPPACSGSVPTPTPTATPTPTPPCLLPLLPILCPLL